MTIMADRCIGYIKIAGKETGIPGMVEEVVIYGCVMITIVHGATGQKNGPGGILPGTNTPDPVKAIK